MCAEVTSCDRGDGLFDTVAEKKRGGVSCRMDKTVAGDGDVLVVVHNDDDDGIMTTTTMHGLEPMRDEGRPWRRSGSVQRSG